jgi:hypothetical protein
MALFLEVARMMWIGIMANANTLVDVPEATFFISNEIPTTKQFMLIDADRIAQRISAHVTGVDINRTKEARGETNCADFMASALRGDATGRSFELMWDVHGGPPGEYDSELAYMAMTAIYNERPGKYRLKCLKGGRVHVKKGIEALFKARRKNILLFREIYVNE